MALGHGRKRVPAHISKTPKRAATSVYVFPRDRKYPIGDLFHAKLALAGIYASSGYTTPEDRADILQAVAEEYPQYNWASYWDNHILGNKPARRRSKSGSKLYPLYNWDRSLGAPARRVAANPRRRKNMTKRRRNMPRRHEILENPYGMRIGGGRRKNMPRRHEYLENPYGMRIGGGREAVRVGKGNRVHIGSGSGTLCDINAETRPSGARVVTCYRCLKLVNMNAGHTADAVFPHRKPGRSENIAIPGGRAGHWVAGKQDHRRLDYDSIPGRGDEEYPTQPRATIAYIEREERQAKKRRETKRRATKQRAAKRAAKKTANPRRRRNRW